MKMYVDKIKLLITSPVKFFASVANEGIKPALIFTSAIILLSLLIKLIEDMLVQRFLGNSMQQLLVILGIGGVKLTYLPIQFIGTIAMLFIYSGAILLTVKLFKGKGDYKNSFKIVAYSNIPSTIITLIPIVGLLSVFYDIVLTVIGVKTLHKLSTGKAIACVLLPLLAIGLLFGILLVAVFFTFIFNKSTPGIFNL